MWHPTHFGTHPSPSFCISLGGPFARPRLAEGALEVRAAASAAEPAQPRGEEHPLQAQQVPGIELGVATLGSKHKISRLLDVQSLEELSTSATGSTVSLGDYSLSILCNHPSGQEPIAILPGFSEVFSKTNPWKEWGRYPQNNHRQGRKPGPDQTQAPTVSSDWSESQSKPGFAEDPIPLQRIKKAFAGSIVNRNNLCIGSDTDTPFVCCFLVKQPLKYFEQPWLTRGTELLGFP